MDKRCGRPSASTARTTGAFGTRAYSVKGPTAGCLTSMTGSGNKLSSKGKGVAVFVDFDGTIARRDVQLAILDRFCPHDWRRIFLDCLAKGQKSRCYLPAWYRVESPAGDYRLHRPGNGARPLFPLLGLLPSSRLSPRILSDGLDIYIAHLLGKVASVPYKVNRVDFSQKAWPSSSPMPAPAAFAPTARRHRSGSPKGSFTIIYIGSGVSDECPAGADLVFAKDSLLVLPGA